MDNKNFWIKTTKETPKFTQKDVLVEGFFTKKGQFMSQKRYFKLYEHFLVYFDETNKDNAKGYCVVDFDLNF